MSAIIQIGQEECMYGKNEHTLKFLSDLSIVGKGTASDLENVIEKINSVGIEVDISIRYDSVIFKDSQ